MRDHPGWFDANGHLRSPEEIAAIPQAGPLTGQPQYGADSIRNGMATIIHQLGDQSANSDDDKLETTHDEVTSHSPELSDRWPK